MRVADLMKEAKEFFDVLALHEEPMGIYYANDKPPDCIAPKEAKLPTREQEKRGEVNYQELFGTFSCIFQSVWRARKKKTAACFDAEHYACLGGAFNLGYLKPQLEVIVHYVSTGFPGKMPGEKYLESPDAVRNFFELLDPRPAPAKYCVFKPLSQFKNDEQPELLIFFDRPESLTGLHQLCCYVTNDYEAVKSPFGAGCSNSIGWPFFYLRRGELKAVLGAWDPACRRFFRPDEVMLTVPWEMFLKMLDKWRGSFLTQHGSRWGDVRKRAIRSRQKWGETDSSPEDSKQ